MDVALETGLAAVGGATLLAATVALSGRSAFYLAPIIWGLYGVRIAETTRQPLLADAAGLAMLVLGSLALATLVVHVIRPLPSGGARG